MRGLSGDFSTMPLKDLVAYLGSRRVSGTLRVMRAGVRKLILLREGQVLSASSNQTREYLGQFLIHMGHLNAEQFAQAHAQQSEANVPLGQILVLLGWVSEVTVRNTLQLKFRETLLDMFRWEEGEFSFDAGAVPQIEGVEAGVDLMDIHREGSSARRRGSPCGRRFPRGAPTWRWTSRGCRSCPGRQPGCDAGGARARGAEHRRAGEDAAHLGLPRVPAAVRALPARGDPGGEHAPAGTGAPSGLTHSRGGGEEPGGGRGGG
ncbi:DUF4388 domain-containing protein [Cystobacter fuscus]